MTQLAAGDRILLELSTFGDRFLSVVTGVGEDGRLFVHAPVPQSVVGRMKTDPRAVVRFAHEGALRGFRTKVLNQIKNPNEIIELAGPEDIFDAEERSEPRCQCRFPATVITNGLAARGLVEDMSSKFTRVRLLDDSVKPLPFVADQEVSLTFHPFDISNGCQVGCKVQKVFVREGDAYMLLEFDGTDEDMRSRIASFVDAQVAHGAPRL